MATIANDTQFIGISPTIDLTGKKSAILNEQTIPVTMEDITSTVRPYKVFTALLTQSGGDDPQTITSGNLTIGVTYFIQLIEGADFSNVGANNIEGEYFIATGTTPNSWGTGGQLEYNTGAPVATVLENTIGNIWFGYNADGSYSINSNGLFTINKTIGFITFNDGGGLGLGDKPFLALYYDPTLYISTATDGNPSDGLLFNTPIEIRVYE